ncbi:ubiquitin carboxyl-terminal hydrolase 15-like [Ptychodera flava]|uniref:ubiquitin carboxyl-terminal hydrolase 15-like n=1 Tax=Ptychodera flava TaxID=63121 RepID=UPI00396A00FD
MAEGGPPELETQKQEICELLKTPLKKGSTWYLVDSRWFKQWKKYVGYDSWDMYGMGEQSSYPGPIDNSGLFKEGTKNVLKEHLIDELDYILVPTEAWTKLASWYGILEGQEGIARKVIENGMFVKHCKVEVYLMEFKLCEHGQLDKPVSKQFSKADTIDTIEKEMRKLFNISEEKETRLWNKYMSNTYEHLGKKDNTVQDANLYQGQVLVIEQKNEDGTWPRQTKSTSSYSSTNTSSSMEINNYSSPSTTTRSASNSYGYSSGSYGSNYYGYGSSSNHRSSQPGLCGLSNLGNTCFMNSGLQCMSNVQPLTSYFLENMYQDELNYDNPLGMRGEIAKAYAELIKIMWSGNYSYTMPRQFKMQVGRFAPQFSGYQQQDSQELLAFLIDGLHEDLNRIRKKPYIELKDADGRPDELVAAESWENHRKRNNSIIVDLFHGLFKSTVVCPVESCRKTSVTFDPFCFLSLPLPIKKERSIEVFVIYEDPFRKPVQMKVIVPKMGCVQDLCNAVSKLTEIPPDKMVVTDVYTHRFHKVFGYDEALSHILDRDDIFVYEVPTNKGDDPETAVIPVYMREKKVRQSNYNYNTVSSTLFGQPLLIPVSRKNPTYQDLYETLLHRMSRYVKKDCDDWIDEDEENDNNTENGEIEMHDDSDKESEDPEISRGEPSTQNNKENAVDDGGIDDDEFSNNDTKDDKRKVEKRKRLFTFTMVNSYGSADIVKLKEDSGPIKFTPRSYVALDWNTKAKETVYDEKAAEEYETHPSMNQRPQRKTGVKLSDCIELFLKKERLGVDDPWYCPNCKKHQQATKKFDLWKLPKVLVVHLKRFSYNRYWRDKLDTLVSFPLKELDMKKYLINGNAGPSVYDLIAVSNHYGGMGGGHYTAYAKNATDEQWYSFDDSSVSCVGEDEVQSKAAYVLFYIRRDEEGENAENRTLYNKNHHNEDSNDKTDEEVAMSEDDSSMDTN